MAINRRRSDIAYGLTNALQKLSQRPISASRAPTTSDKALPGTIWLDTTGNDAYILLKVAANSATWIATGSGAGVFDSLTVTNAATIGTGLTVTTGAITLGGLGLGVVRSSAAGLLSSVNGTNGQLLIGSTGVIPAWGSVTSGDGSVVIGVGAGTLDLTVSGATASTFPTDNGTATPVLGATTIAGGTNVNSSALGGTVTINVDNDPTFSGLVTAQAGITQSAGTTTITSDTDAAQAIYLHADAGTNETIRIHSDQGTAATSINLLSDVGGIAITAVSYASNDAISLGAASGGIDVDAALQLNLASSQNAADAIVISSSAGGIDITSAGAAGEDIDISASSSVNITSTEDVAQAIYLRANAGVSETIHIHSDQGTGTASVYVHSDVGGVTLDAGLASDDAINLVASNGGVDIDGALQVNIASSENAADALVLTSSAGGIDILASGAAAGEDIDIIATGSSVNIQATEAAADAITINASNAAGGINVTTSGGDLDISSGGGLNLSSTEDAADAVYVHVNGGTSETIRLHSDQGTGAASVHLESDVGGITLTSTGLASDDGINLNSVAGGVDIDGALQINIASSEDAADSIVIESTAGGIDILASGAAAGEDIDITATGSSVNITSTEAVANAIVINASDAAGGIDIDSGTNGMTVDTTGAVLINAAASSQFNTSGAGIDLSFTSDAGRIVVTTGEDAADTIYLHADAGTSEKIRIHSDQGTGLDSVELASDAGGVKVTSAALAATTGLHLAQGAATAAVQVGSGAPAHAAPQGSLYLRTDGSSVSTRAYINSDGSTGWVSVTTSA